MFVSSQPSGSRTHIPLPVLSCIPFPHHILCSHPFSSLSLTAMGVLLTLAVIIVIAIARTAPSNAQRCRLCPVLIIIMLNNYLIPFQWANGLEVVGHILLPASRLNLCPEIIATVPRRILPGAFNLPRAGCLLHAVIDIASKGPSVVTLPIFHWVTGLVKYLPQI
jgi:hypothetical protein